MEGRVGSYDIKTSSRNIGYSYDNLDFKSNK